mmetsp:Transcript_30412/g.83344  ORF Transcript_30412/g.83344 Transcript_30412/m.83344 type:complete len:284 (+) Transcript_30412:190-1041(+)
MHLARVHALHRLCASYRKTRVRHVAPSPLRAARNLFAGCGAARDQTACGPLGAGCATPPGRAIQSCTCVSQSKSKGPKDAVARSRTRCRSCGGTAVSASLNWRHVWRRWKWARGTRRRSAARCSARSMTALTALPRSSSRQRQRSERTWWRIQWETASWSLAARQKSSVAPRASSKEPYCLSCSPMSCRFSSCTPETTWRCRPRAICTPSLLACSPDCSNAASAASGGAPLVATASRMAASSTWPSGSQRAPVQRGQSHSNSKRWRMKAWRNCGAVDESHSGT